MRVAIIGAGVAGSFLAWRLSERGWDCLIYDGAGPREKPCGGGCTGRVIRRYPFLPAASVPGNQIRRVLYQSSRYKEVAVELDDPIWVYSRKELDGFLLEQALRNGARLRSARVVNFARIASEWRLRDSHGETQRSDFLVGADGATSSVRKRLSEPFAAEDLSVAAGYYVPGQFHADRVHIRFLERGWNGYLWAFPRTDHVSLGVMNQYRRSSASELRARLNRFAKDLYGIEPREDCRPYAAPIPTLRATTLKRQLVGGESWALVGDAAGFVDPITAEGIAYALRSAELLAESLLAWAPAAYSQACRVDFGCELIQAARLKGLFYGCNLLGDSFTNRMLGVLRRSAFVRKAQSDLIAGRLTYYGLFGQLALRSPRIVADIWRSEPTPH